MEKLFIRGLLTIALLFSVGLAFSEAKIEKNTINMLLQDEMWLKSRDVGLEISVDVVGTKSELAQVREKLLAHLQNLHKSDWHITRFDRSKDSSDLLRFNIVAHSRVPESVLTHVNDGIKKLNKPGTKFTVENIDFSPSEREVEQAKSDLRGKLYERAKIELKKANTIFAEQPFEIGSIRFNPPQYPMHKTRQMMTMAMSPEHAVSQQADSVESSQKLVMTAYLELVNYKALGG